MPGGVNVSPRLALQLQRLVGNRALVDAVRRRTGTPPPTPVAPLPVTVQRAPVGMPAQLTDDINRVLDDTVAPDNTDAKLLAAILKAIRTAPVDERPNTRRDPRLVRKLPTLLQRASSLRVMRALGATLAERLPMATATAPAPAPTAAGVTAEITAAPAAERRVVLSDPALVSGIETALPRPDAMRALASLGAALREVLNAGMRGAGAEAAAMVSAARTAPTGQKADVRADGATMVLLRDRLPRAERLMLLASLGAPFVDQLNATVDGPTAVDGVAAIRLSSSATAPSKSLALADRELIARLRTALPPAQMRDVLVGLRASLADIFDVVVATPAGTEADLVRIVGTFAADATQRRAALDDAALVDRLKTLLTSSAYWRVRLLLAFGTQAQVDAPSRQIPALTNGAAYRAGIHIEANEQADALRVVIEALVARRRIDPAGYKDIVLEAGTGDASTTFPGFTEDPVTHRFTPTAKPSIQVFGGAFTSASVLASALMRECARAVRGSRPAATDPSAAGNVNAAEVESLLYEVEQRAASGIARYGARMHDLGGRLTTAFGLLDDPSKRRLQTRVTRAQAAIAAVPIAAAPAETRSLTATLSAELAKALPDTAAMMAALRTASPAVRRPVAGNHALVGRITGALTRADAVTALALLGAPLSQRLEYLLQLGAPAAEVVAAVTGATAADRRTVSQNRALLDRVVAAVGDGQVGSLLAALGGSLVDELDRALAAATPAAAVTAAITAATAERRQAVERNTAFMGRLRAALGSHEYWRAQLLLRYGTVAAIPSAGTSLLAAFAAGPAIADVRTAFRRLTDVEIRVARTLPGIRQRLQDLLPTATDLVIAFRMLDQGMLDAETGMGGAWSETLQVPNAAGIFVPTVFPGTSGWDIEYRRDQLEVTVRVNVTAATPAANTALPRSKRIWQSNIERAWNRKYKVTNANHDLPLVFNVNFTSSSAHHNVTAHAGVPVWPGLNLNNWFVDDLATSSHNRQYVNNAAIHEFGHMIGSPDEYMVSQAHYLTVVGTNATTDPNATPTSDAAGTQSFTNNNSVMGGQLAGTVLPGPVQQRHVNFMLTWINAHRNPAEPVFTLAGA